MKTITFRPLRLIKKSGKIVVANYLQWRKIKVADNEKFKLIVVCDYNFFPSDKVVCNARGEQLFWFDYNPADVPVFPFFVGFPHTKIRSENERYAIQWGDFTGGLHYNSEGMDCDGVPVLSHYDANYIAGNIKDVHRFVPLTVEKATQLMGWFLYNLDNAEIEFIK